MSNDRFIRTSMMLGKVKMKKLAKSSVTIVGIGAVGSNALEALARMGIGRFHLIDFDVVNETNFNRQLIATEKSIGKKKIDVAKKRILSINPDCEVITTDDFLGKDNVEQLMDHESDVVVDAIDSLNPKAHLLKHLIEKQQAFVTSMGAARRYDPLAVTVGDLEEVRGCRLASRIRKRLRKFGYEKGIRCVYSKEIPEGDTVGKKAEDQDLVRGRVRLPNGSLSYITGIFGYVVAGEVIKKILD